MNTYTGGAAANKYLAQQVNGASPEHLVFMLLEGAQRFLIQAEAALRRRDIPARARLVNRVSSIIEELAIRLNHEEGGELVDNLTRVYDWWLKELFEASQKNQVERLERIERQIGQMKNAWADLERRGNSGQRLELTPQGMVG
jgi:flagellar protein FliS